MRAPSFSGPSNSFPFTAIVGMDDLQLALILATISPAIGGVLIRGEKGTAKSTAVRALTEILPPVDVVPGCRFSCDPDHPDSSCPDGPHAVLEPAPDRDALGRAAAERAASQGAGGRGVRAARLVELPVGATEDRVLGSLHLEKALAEGVTAYEPGLLAAAHRGLLYVDEVNLLHDHLVDVLLDAAAMGRASVERDGVSVTHPARFVLVGTMNPEEGELRPQLLDRFGLTVDVVASRDPAVRVEVMRARLTYEADPESFVARYDGAQRELAERIVKARDLLTEVILTDSALRQIAEICASFDVDGMRADLVTARTAVAHAAWSGRTVVEVDDVRAAAKLALPHRRRRNPFDAPGLDDQQLEEAINNSTPPEDPDDDPSPGGPGSSGGSDGNEAGDHRQADGSGESTDKGAEPAGTQHAGTDTADPTTAADATAPDRLPSNAGDRRKGPEDQTTESDGAGVAPSGEVVGSSAPYKARLLSVQVAGAGVAGRRSRAITEVGRVVGDRGRVGHEAGRPHLLGTMRNAAPYQKVRGRSGPGLVVRADDVRLAVREGREGNLVLFCVDASGSMGTKKRMGEVKTAIVSLLLDAYQRRDTVGLVTFAGAGATVALPPTGSVETAVRRLESLPTGGRTPLAEGLLQAAEVLRIAAIRDPRRRPLLVLVTDGRATHGENAFARARQAAGWLAQRGIATVVVDCEPRRGIRLGLSAELAADLGAEYLDLGDVAAGNLIRTVTERKAA
ncbi:magnesium chelatase subunit D family protein [Kribbella sp. VKM Ac-2566]|uniref:magnesium chelatase subunit D family protein n=1 Tax=Kribbella sp. VKM Ac-2566 TaxID=2512218 RepID=UPI0010D728C5|nr:magnesium chelatase subunit D family protein [Kribbella sp. VKM Ac-2566]TDW86131.1 magnesium chelatase subunit D [Kribbella sp. VKM Ac-2566]